MRLQTGNRKRTRELKQEQADCHNDHAGYQSINGQMVLPVFLSSGQQLVKGDKYHNPADCRKDDPKNGIRHELGKDKVTQDSAHRFRNPG